MPLLECRERGHTSVSAADLAKPLHVAPESGSGSAEP